MIPGEIISKNKEIVLNRNKQAINVQVTNHGDRPIQVGSHYHFFEVNSGLHFEREQTIGYHLNIPAGTAVRFEPGEMKTISIVPFGGARVMMGFNNLVNAKV